MVTAPGDMCKIMRPIITVGTNIVWLTATLAVLTLASIEEDWHIPGHYYTRTQVGLSITSSVLIIIIYMMGVFNFTKYEPCIKALKYFLWFSVVIIQFTALLYCWLAPSTSKRIHAMAILHIFITVSQFVLYLMTFSDKSWINFWYSVSTSLCRPFGTSDTVARSDCALQTNSVVLYKA
ncbi:uncharacterized protein LOC128960157 [Oppia nitens]|uniref:uncharacterized protein LOC128960157 n=1 Tax=Oppia nitens TaxID=1686743 RepID=UPI0023DB585F|nr:uncharacterized protein LOC128960157 [Oppia nitens]